MINNHERANAIVKKCPGIDRPNPDQFEAYLESGQGRKWKKLRDLIEKELDAVALNLDIPDFRV